MRRGLNTDGIRCFKMYSGLDSDINYRSTFYIINKLYDYYKVDDLWINCNTVKFCSFESVIQLAQLRYDGHKNPYVSQQILCNLFFKKVREVGTSYIGHWLNVNSKRILRHYYNMLECEARAEPYVISLGLGLIFSQLLEQQEQYRIKVVLKKIQVHAFDLLDQHQNEYDLLWG